MEYTHKQIFSSVEIERGSFVAVSTLRLWFEDGENGGVKDLTKKSHKYSTEAGAEKASKILDEHAHGFADRNFPEVPWQESK